MSNVWVSHVVKKLLPQSKDQYIRNQVKLADQLKVRKALVLALK